MTFGEKYVSYCMHWYMCMCVFTCVWVCMQAFLRRQRVMSCIFLSALHFTYWRIPCWTWSLPIAYSRYPTGPRGPLSLSPETEITGRTSAWLKLTNSVLRLGQQALYLLHHLCIPPPPLSLDKAECRHVSVCKCTHLYTASAGPRARPDSQDKRSLSVKGEPSSWARHIIKMGRWNLPVFWQMKTREGKVDAIP